jgi:hypothetical protein
LVGSDHDLIAFDFGRPLVERIETGCIFDIPSLDVETSSVPWADDSTVVREGALWDRQWAFKAFMGYTYSREVRRTDYVRSMLIGA